MQRKIHSYQFDILLPPLQSTLVPEPAISARDERQATQHVFFSLKQGTGN